MRDSMSPHKLHLRRRHYGAPQYLKSQLAEPGRQAESQIPQNATRWSSVDHMQVSPPSTPSTRSPLNTSTTGAATSRDVYLRTRASQRMPHLWPYTSCPACAAHQTSLVATEFTSISDLPHRPLNFALTSNSNFETLRAL